jgi:heme/copper-type cytochrome/quinol oxidase subunit 2
MFCAAIPATLAVGAAARQKQHHSQQKSEEEGNTPSKPVLPAGPATAVIVTGLAIASVVYHTQLGGI